MALPVSAAPVTYVVDDAQSELVVILRPDGLLEGASDWHAIRAQHVTGSVIYDAEAPQNAQVSVSAPADALENDDPAVRKRHRLAEFKRDRKAVAENMRAPKQLDVKQYPTLSFTSTTVRVNGTDLELEGLLNIRGVAVKVTMPIAVSLTDGVLTGRTQLQLTHTLFKFAPSSSFMGTVRNADAMTLKVTLVAKAATN